MFRLSWHQKKLVVVAICQKNSGVEHNIIRSIIFLSLLWSTSCKCVMVFRPVAMSFRAPNDSPMTCTTHRAPYDVQYLMSVEMCNNIPSIAKHRDVGIARFILAGVIRATCASWHANDCSVCSITLCCTLSTVHRTWKGV